MNLNTALCNATASQNTTKLCPAVLKAHLTEKDKDNVDFVEAFELLQITANLGLLKHTNNQEQWITANLTHIMKRNKTKDTDLKSNEIDTTTTPDEFILAIKRWKE